jgi:hypothetical protein
MGALLGAVRGLPGFIKGLLVGAAIVGIVWTSLSVANGGGQNGLLGKGPPSPDIPPAEYLYLDGSRVLAYIGQVEGGLSKSEKQTLGITQSVSGSLTAGAAAQLNASAQSQQSSEKTVSPTVADRAYEFLRVLRANGDAGRQCRGQTLKAGRPWLGTIDARLTKHNSEPRIKKQLRCIGVGNFVRILNAHLYLPPYASVLKKARYALPYLGDFKRRRHPAESPVPRNLRRAAARYRKSVGRNPRLPFVLPAVSDLRDNPPETVTFFVPTRYLGLTAEPSLLSGDVTVVGKIVHNDLRSSKPSSAPQASPERFPHHYVDFETIETFGGALRRAPTTLLNELQVCSLRELGVPQLPPPKAGAQPAYPRLRAPSKCSRQRRAVIAPVRGSVTFPAPVVVVVPIAIYR